MQPSYLIFECVNFKIVSLVCIFEGSARLERNTNQEKKSVMKNNDSYISQQAGIL